MDKIIVVIKETFAEFDESVALPDMMLGEIPGWDSMNSVNLAIALESAFGVDLSEKYPRAEMTLIDLVSLLRAKGAQLD
jgi:acyl carrier protein